MRCSLLISVLTLLWFAVRPQSISIPQAQYNISFDANSATNSQRMPFWLYANQYGVIPKTSPAFIGRATITNAAKDTLHHSWNQLRLIYGLDAAAIVGQSTPKNQLVEGYAAIRYGCWELYSGRRKEMTGLLGDTLLSSGSYAWSANAPPFVKVQLSVPKFTNVPFTKGLISFKGTFAHGWLDTLAVSYGGQGINAVKGYLHEKSLFLKIGKPKWKINVITGFTHLAQWGGEDQIWPDGLPQKQAWWAVMVGKPWEGSRVGNHLGTIDIGVSWQLRQGKSLFFYRQNIFDDGSLYTFLNIKDGLQGVVFTNSDTQDYGRTLSLQKIMIEWLNTTNQGGDVFDFQAGIFGRDNYFNHYVYTQGWSFKNKMIGTPFIPNQTDVKNTFPAISNAVTNNNRVQMIHLAANGWLDDWKWMVKTSLSSNYGTYSFSFPDKQVQLSTLIQIQKELPWLRGLDWCTSVAFDIGKLYEPSIGLQVGLRKRGFF